MSGSAGVRAVSAAWSCGRNIDSTNSVSIQEAIDQLDQYQNQVRIHLFRLLQRLATQPGEGLDLALGQLEAQADKVIAESPEASILPHIGTYREIVVRIQGLITEISRKHAADDVEKQVQEFEERLAEGHLSDAAYCCVRLVKMAQDAEAELVEQDTRQQQQQEEGGEAGGDGPTGATAGPDGAEGEAGPQPQTPHVTAESVALLQETAERCSVKLREMLDACCEEAVAVDTPRGEVVVRAALRGGVVRVPDIFSALQVLGLQEVYLRRMTGRLVSGALEPMLAAPCCVTVTPAVEPGAPATLAWQPAPPGAVQPARSADRHGGGGGASGAPCDPEHCCQHLLRLLATWLLEFDEGLMEVLGAPFWRAAADCYIANVARPFIAANPEDMEGCEAVVAAAADLEAMAESLSFTNGEEPYLAPAVESLARHALSSRQEKYLERARQLLVGPSQGQAAGGGAAPTPSWETVAVGQALPVDEEYYRRLAAGELQDWEVQDPPGGCRSDGPLLAVGRYLVTSRANELVQLVTGLMEDACGGSRAVSRALLHAVSSIALMARTLPPVASASAEQLAVPQLGLLAVNDLQHLAAMLLLLSQAYGAALEAATGEPVVPGLMAEALQLRAAARGVMRNQLQHQYGSLGEILAGLGGLRNVGAADAKVGMRHRRAVQQLLHSLGRLGRAVTEVLTPEDGVAMAAAVLNHIGGNLTTAVMAKSDMTHDECVELAALLGPLAEGAVESWLAGAVAAGPDLSGVPLGVVASAITARAIQMRKLRCVLQVVASVTISAISDAWDGGDLAPLAPGELEHLLMAISEDSPGRRAMLQKLQ